MNVIVAALGMLLLTTVPVLPAGFAQVKVPDPNGPPLEAGIWYPSDAPASSQRLGPYTQGVAVGGEVSGYGLPLVVMSHGTRGSFQQHYDTALALAEAGFVVASVTHTGDNFRDGSATLFVSAGFENRPRHIKALIDYMLAAWPQRGRLDPKRIGIFGFSAGAFTALVAIGGEPDLSLGRSYCAAHLTILGAAPPAQRLRDLWYSRPPSFTTRVSPPPSWWRPSAPCSRRKDLPASRPDPALAGRGR